MIIVALGAGLSHGRIGLASKLRAMAAAALYHRHPSLVIMSGGRTAGHRGKSEAETMKDYVTRSWRYHVPAEDVYTDTTSLSTPENVRNVVALLRHKDLSDVTILLVAGRRNRLQAAEYFRAERFTVHPYTVRQVLMRFPSLHVPTVFDPILSPADRRRNLLLHYLQIIDPRGRLAAWVGRWIRR